MREAEWVVSPILEREAASIRRREANVDRLIAGGALTLLVRTLALPFFPPWTWMESILYLAILLGTAVGVVLRNACREFPDAADVAMRAEFGGGVGWLVEMTVLRGEAPTGIDRGMLWFEEDRLLFAGHRTSFALAPRQAYAVSERERTASRREGARTVRLKGGGRGGPLSIRVRPFVGPYHKGDLGDRLDAWSRDAIEAPEGSLPPSRFGPSAPSPARLLVRASRSSLYWGAFVLSATYALVLPGSSPGAILCVGPPLFGLWRLVAWVARIESPTRAWAAYRDRRRVE